MQPTCCFLAVQKYCLVLSKQSKTYFVSQIGCHINLKNSQNVNMAAKNNNQNDIFVVRSKKCIVLAVLQSNIYTLDCQKIYHLVSLQRIYHILTTESYMLNLTWIECQRELALVHKCRQHVVSWLSKNIV